MRTGTNRRERPEDLFPDVRRPAYRSRASGSTDGRSRDVVVSEDEIAELEAGAASGDGGSAPRKAKAFWPSLGRLFATLTDHKAGIAMVLLFGAVSTVLSVWAPAVLGQAMDVIFDGWLDGSIDFVALSEMLFFVLGMYLVASVFDWLQGFVLNEIVMRVVYRLRQKIEAKVNRLPLSYFDTRQRGDLLSRTTNDVDNVQTAMQQAFASLFYAVLTIVGITIMMFALSWQLALIALVALPIAALVVGLVGSKSQKLFAAQWKNTGRLNGHIEESFTGHDLVTVFGRQEAMRGTFDERNEDLYEASFRAQFYSGMIMPIMQWVTYLGYVGIALVGGLRVASGQMSLGQVTAFIQYSRRVQRSRLGEMAGMANMLISGVASAERIFELLDADEQEEDLSQQVAAGALDPHGPQPAELEQPVQGRVQFEHVAFSYTSEKPLISDLSIVAEPGQTVAIVGPTGAGQDHARESAHALL